MKPNAKLISVLILWRIDIPISKGIETNETTAVAMQRRGKHASTTIELLLETVLSAQAAPRSYLGDNWNDPVGCQLKGSL
jgi:hypothetical protein